MIAPYHSREGPAVAERRAGWANPTPLYLSRTAAQCRIRVVVGVLLALVVVAASACSNHRSARGSSDPAVERARIVVAHALNATGDYSGPLHGPPAQRPGLVVFVAADLTDGGIAGVARGVEQAARAIDWPLKILDGQGTVEGQTAAFDAALSLRPAGVILGGVDAAGQEVALREAQAQGIPVVGWQSVVQPGPDPQVGLFTNVTTDSGEDALLAASYAIADSDGTASAVIFTDSQYAIDRFTADVMASTLGKCRRCSVLRVFDAPIVDAEINVAGPVTALLESYKKRLTYLLAVNGAYITGAQAALIGAGRQGDQPPYSIAAGDGDASEFERIRAGQYQKATVADPLNMQGWQLIDELNRARAGQPPSDYVAPPHLVTRANVPSGAVFDPSSGYRKNFLRIWRSGAEA